MEHTTEVCKRDNQSARFHAKSWSHEFACPTCGKSRRWNGNFLGNRYEVVCDGDKITRRMKQVWVDRLAARV